VILPNHVVKCDMISDDKSPQYMTSAELEEAIRRHREHTKKLLAEVRSRRASQAQTKPPKDDKSGLLKGPK
jgi:hypothetical protein